MQTEVHSSKGRCDVLIKTNNYIYAVELKLNGSGQDALDQIVNTNYLQSYEFDKREKIALGISFSSKDRLVSSYEIKEW